MVIDKALQTYGDILSLMLDIERLIPRQDAGELSAKYKALQELEAKAKEIDKEVLSLLRRDNTTRDGRITQLLDRIQEVQEINQRITPQIHGIMAVLRNEMKKLRTGNTMMRGYHSNTDKTGRLISSSG